MLRTRSTPRWTCSILLLAWLASCRNEGPQQPVATTISLDRQTGALDAIGATVQFTATVKDQRGQAMTAAVLEWSSSNSAVASVSQSGVVTAAAAGSADVMVRSDTAHARQAIAIQPLPSALTVVSGNQQTALAGQALGAPLIVQVNDRLSHPVAGASVRFAVLIGGGSLTPATIGSNAAGQAQTAWTLGTTTGAQSATATVTGIASPITFTATATSADGVPTIASIAPDTLVEGQQTTIRGTNFGVTAGENTVSIDGLAATVLAASATSLTVRVPTATCRPTRGATVNVTAGGQTGARANVPVHPAAFTTLAVGQEVIVQDPSQFCFQLRATTGGSETYMIGLSTPAETPGAVLPFTLTASTGLPTVLAASARALPLQAPAARQLTPGGDVLSPDLRAALQRTRDRSQAEAQLRQWERAHLPRLIAGRRSAAASGSVSARSLTRAIPAVGDVVTLRVINTRATNLCSSYATISAKVRVIGTAGIWVEDLANPSADALTLADIQAASDQFDTKIYATDVNYFGTPSDIDGNGRAIIVLTWEVNKDARIAGFVFTGDLYASSDCAASNGGEMYYSEVPDPANAAGGVARPKATILAGMPRLIAHEFTHIIQNSQRRILQNGTNLSSWEAEGQATFAEELVGNVVLGNTSYQNYGRNVAFSMAGFGWYGDGIVGLSEYYGVLGSHQQAANAPDLCTVYGNTQLTSLPCDAFAFYGASWGFQRYIADQYGPTYPGGLPQLTRDWISKNAGLSGTANVAALLGVDYDALFVRFATALALDDLDNGTGTAWIPAPFRTTSWNTSDLRAHLSSCCDWGWLAPPVMGFAAGSASRSVRGGSTAYTMLAAAGAHAAEAIAVTDLAGRPLTTGLRPALWITRVR